MKRLFSKVLYNEKKKTIGQSRGDTVFLRSQEQTSSSFLQTFDLDGKEILFSLFFNLKSYPQPSRVVFSPAKPRRAPASERSLQGNEAVAKAMSGILLASSLCTSPKTNSSLSPKWSRYMRCLSSSMSLANTTRQPARSSPIRIKPMPAKNSPKVFPVCVLIFASVCLHD